MRWKDHIRITKLVVERVSIELSAEEIDALIDGSIEPDTKRGHDWGAHHKGREGEIIKRIWWSRKNFLKGERKKSAHELGIALHFLADKVVPSINLRIPQTREAHNEFEFAISKIDEFEPKIISVDNPFEIATLFEEKLEKGLPPKEALERVAGLSLGIANIIWRDIAKPSESEIEFLKKKLSEFREQFLFKVIGGISFFLFTFLTFFVSSFFFYGTFLSFFVLLPCWFHPVGKLRKKLQEWYGKETIKKICQKRE